MAVSRFGRNPLFVISEQRISVCSLIFGSLFNHIFFEKNAVNNQFYVGITKNLE